MGRDGSRHGRRREAGGSAVHLLHARRLQRVAAADRFERTWTGRWAPGAASAAPNGPRGGRDRTLDARPGGPQLRIPKPRQGSYFPPLLEPRKTSERAPVAVIPSRPPARLRPSGRIAPGGRRGSAACPRARWTTWCRRRGCRGSAGAPSAGRAGASTSAWVPPSTARYREAIRPRRGGTPKGVPRGERPYLWPDATYLKQREGGRIVSVAATVAAAADARGAARSSVRTSGHRRQKPSGPPSPAARSSVACTASSR